MAVRSGQQVQDGMRDRQVGRDAQDPELARAVPPSHHEVQGM